MRHNPSPKHQIAQSLANSPLREFEIYIDERIPDLHPLAEDLLHKEVSDHESTIIKLAEQNAKHNGNDIVQSNDIRKAIEQTKEVKRETLVTRIQAVFGPLLLGLALQGFYSEFTNESPLNPTTIGFNLMVGAIGLCLTVWFVSKA